MFPYLNIWKFCERFLYKKSTTFISQVAQLSPILCDPIHCSMPSFPVHHQLPKFAQIHVHRFDDAIQPSHSLLPPSLPALNLSQHQSLFQWVCSLHQVAKVLEVQRQSFQWISGLIFFRIHWFDLFAIQGTLQESPLASQYERTKYFKNQCWAIGCCCVPAQSCPLFVTPWTVACQAPLSMEFSRQECRAGLLFPSPGGQTCISAFPALSGGFITTGATWEGQLVNCLEN